MLVKLGDVRALVREMAFSGMMPRKNASGIDDLDRYQTSKKHVIDATRYFAQFSVNVYVVPMGPIELKDFRFKPSQESRRCSWYSDVTPELVLSVTGVSVDEAERVSEEINSGATLLVNRASVLQKGFLPSMWMMVHALYDDSTPCFSRFNDAEKIFDQLMAAYDSAHGGRINRKALPNEVFKQFFTMRSARDGRLNDINDVLPEVLTQEVLTKNGFTYKPSGDVRIDSLLEELKHVVETARSELEDSISGHVVIIDTVS